MDGERVEFLEVDPAPRLDDDEISVVSHGGHGRDRRPGTPRPGRWTAGIAVLVAAVVALTVFLAVRSPTPSATPRATATPALPSPVNGLIALPRAFTTARMLVTAPGRDVVWALDAGAEIVRVDAGRVTNVQLLEAQATAMAVSPDGRDLYVGVAGEAPSILVVDATTLALGRSVSLPSAPQAIAVSVDAVWAAVGGAIRHFGLHDLVPLSSVELAGVITVGDLAASYDVGSGAERLTGLVTTGIDGARLLSVETLTGTVTLGDPHLGDVALAHSQLLTWLSWAEPGSKTMTTAGYSVPPGLQPEASAGDEVVFGARLYDSGEGYGAFYVVASLSSVISCRDEGGFETGKLDVATTVPGVVAIGPVVRSVGSFYVGTNKGLVRTGVGACR